MGRYSSLIVVSALTCVMTTCCRAADPASQRASDASPSPSAMATAEDAGADSAEAGTPMPEGFGAAKPCPTRINGLVDAASRWPALLRNPDVPALMRDAQRGHPQRVQLQAANSNAYCPCPTFLLLDHEPDQPHYTYAHLVFPKSLKNGHAFSDIKTYGLTEYRITGYFSGRLIDTYEWSSLQYGKPYAREHADEMERNYWSDKHAEFCVETWCVIPNPDPGTTPDKARRSVEAREYRRMIEKMVSAGVTVCTGSE